MVSSNFIISATVGQPDANALTGGPYTIKGGFWHGARNRQPILLSPIPNLTNTAGSTFSFTVPFNTFNDPDGGQHLIYSITGLPEGMTFDSVSLRLTGRPTNSGTFQVTITATDNRQPPLSTNYVFQIVIEDPLPLAVHWFTVDGGGERNSGANSVLSGTIGQPDAGELTGGAFRLKGGFWGGAISRIVRPPVNHVPNVVNPIPNQTNFYGRSLNFAIPPDTFSDSDTNQILSYLASGLPPGIVFDGLSQTLSGALTNVGIFAVTISATDNGAPPLSANAAFVLAILKAPLTITADNESRPFGTTNPPLTGTIIGETNNDGIITTFSTTAVAASRPGNYPITPLLADPKNRLTNYSVMANNGILTVLCATNTQPLFQELYSFTAGGNDGHYPSGSIVLGSDGALYGTTYLGGGGLDAGTVFKVNTDGTGYQRLVNFSDFLYTNGNRVWAGLLEGSDGKLYGAAYETSGGTGGTVFSLSKNGAGFTVLHNFSSADGVDLYGTLIEAFDGFLYGTAHGGGHANNSGAIFRIAKDGSNFSVVYSFTAGLTNAYGPQDGVMQASDGMLYGATPTGGSNQVGTIYRVTTNGSNFAILKHFLGGTNGPKNPRGVLVEGSDSALYGTTEWGADTNSGSVQGAIYKINKDGSGFATLHRFSFSPGNPNDGSDPYAGLLKTTGGVLLGTTAGGGSNALGTIFRINEDGTDYRVLWNMTGGSSGRLPYGLPAVAHDGALYGVTYTGGNGFGDVFALTLPDTGPILVQPIADQSAPYGSNFSYAFPANTFSNADFGQTLAYTASNVPPGIAFDGPSRTFSGSSLVPGNYLVTVTAIDTGCRQLTTNGTFNFAVVAAPPSLQITCSNGSVRVSWSPPGPGFVLQQSDSLNPLIWNDAPSGATNPITVPITGSERLFRLRN